MSNNSASLVKRLVSGATVALLAAAVSGCISPEAQESALRFVKIGPDGEVYQVEQQDAETIACQDYWQRFTLWDYAVSWPENMTSEDATAVCRSSEQMALEGGPLKPWQIATGSVDKAHDNDIELRDAANASVGGYNVNAK